MKYPVEYRDNNTIISNVKYFDLDLIFDCGQCFRFEKHGGIYEGVALGRRLKISQEGEKVTLYDCKRREFEDIWTKYLSLDVDYESICSFYQNMGDEVLCRASSCASGIRLLRQDRWETLCSFIISQNNNIPRIKKIIERLCQTYGRPFEVLGNTYYDFPSAKTLASLSQEEIFALGTGFRAKYICDCAQKVASGEIDLSLIDSMNLKQSTEYLCRIKGVGPKVASCALLFAFDKRDAFPVDVWVKKILSKYYPAGLDIKALGENAGIAQQYLFYYERYTVSEKKPKNPQKFD